MTSRLMIREAGQTRFDQQNGDFPSERDAYDEGERMCREGNVEEFQVWTLHSHMKRDYQLKNVTVLENGAKDG